MKQLIVIPKYILLMMLLGLAPLQLDAACPSDEAYPDVTFPELIIETNLGDVVVELDRRRAPLTVNHFLHLVKNQAYDNNLVHRVVPDYVVQMGAFKADYSAISSCGRLFNESGNGLTNDRGTLAMARFDDPHSAETSFFINLKDNGHLNPNKKSWGYAVFGYVVSGMDVVDLMTERKTEFNQTIAAKDVPIKPITIKSVRLNL